MKFDIRYYTETGNTKKLADAISEVVGVEAKTIQNPITEEVEVLFLGTAIYAFGLSKEVKEFLSSLDNKLVKKIVVFSTTAISKKARNMVEKLTKNLGIVVDEKNFYCKGSFKFLNKGRPNENDIASCKEFVTEYIK